MRSPPSTAEGLCGWVPHSFRGGFPPPLRTWDRRQISAAARELLSPSRLQTRRAGWPWGAEAEQPLSRGGGASKARF